MAEQVAEDVYATLLLSDTYLPGALVLAHSLRDSGTDKKLVALVTLDTVAAEVITELKNVFDYVIPVPRVQNQATPANLDLMNRPDLHSAFTKIHLWRQLQFRKIVYIDADIVAYRAPDELFDLPYDFAAAPDIGWPDLFNTGVMVLTPDLGEYYALKAMAERGISFDGADQGLLNMHFKNTYHRLPFTYNVTPSAHYQYLPAYRHFQSNITMVHFIGADKPWFQGRGVSSGSPAYDEMVGQWWSVYDRHYRKASPPLEAMQRQPPEIVQYFVKGEFQPRLTARSTIDFGSSSYDQDQGHHAETSQPPAPEPYRPPMEPSWDAQWQPPPTNAKPEALNFPQAHYEMSQDTTPFIPPERYPSPPKDMWYQVPKEEHHAPAAIFPWEVDRPKATRVFADAGPAESFDTQPGQSGLFSSEHDASRAADAEPSFTTGSPSVDLRTEPTTPTMHTTSSHRALPASDPWASYTRTNAWDDVPQIERYVDAVQRHQKQHRRNRSRGLGSGDFSAGSGGKEGDFEEEDEEEDETRYGIGNVRGGGGGGGKIGFRRRSSKLTDFPSEVERPSLPVTPAPIRRSKHWGGGGPNFGDDDDAGRGESRLPAAAGVPQQADWDPVAQLQKLAKAQSEMLLEKLSHADEKEVKASADPRSTVVVSPKPVKPGDRDTSSVRSIFDRETVLEQPSYSGPGPVFEKDEDYPLQSTGVALPSEEEMDVLDT